MKETGIPARKSTSARFKSITVLATRPALTQLAVSIVNVMLASLETESNVFVIQTNAMRIMVVAEKIHFVIIQAGHSCACV